MDEQLQSILTLLGSMNAKLDKLEASRQDVNELKKEMKEVQSKVKDFEKSLVDLEKRVAALEVRATPEPTSAQAMAANATTSNQISSQPAERKSAAFQHSDEYYDDLYESAFGATFEHSEADQDYDDYSQYESTGVWDICNYDSDTGNCTY